MPPVHGMSIAMIFISGAVLLFSMAAVIEAVTDYYEHNFQHHHDRYNALLHAGLLHTTFTNFAFLVLMISTLITAQQNKASSAELVRIVQVSIAGSIVVSILFNLGVAVFLGGLNFKHHSGRLNFSKELANQDAEMLTIAVIILSLPTLASKLSISPGFLDKVTYRVPESTISNLSVIVSGVMLFIYLSYLLWTVFKIDDRQVETTEDVGDDVLQTLFRAINKVFVMQGAVSLYEAMRSPSLYYPDAESEAHDLHEIQQQMDALDASLEEDEEEERALLQLRRAIDVGHVGRHRRSSSLTGGTTPRRPESRSVLAHSTACARNTRERSEVWPPCRSVPTSLAGVIAWMPRNAEQ